MAERILLHTCCAPCSTVPVPALREDGFEVVTYFFNPNVHPFSEFRNRLKSMEQFLEQKGVSGFFYRGYPLESFLRLQISRLESRCAYCYELRLSAAARKARDEGVRLFSTTLLVSPYQNHELLKEIGENVRKRSGIGFLYTDWRSRWRETRTLAREERLYLQKYCGCIFSEMERHLGKEGKTGQRSM